MIKVRLLTKWDTEINLYPDPNDEDLEEILDDIRQHFKNRWIYLGLGACIDMNDIKYILEAMPDKMEVK